MKISFLVGTNRLSFEGLGRSTIKLKEFLEANGFEVLINSLNADIYHTHSSGVYDSFLLSKIKRKKQKPCIYSLYSTATSDLFDYLRNSYEDYSYRLFRRSGNYNFLMGLTSVLPLKLRAFRFKEFDKVVVLSESVKSQLFDNTQVIHLGVDVNKFKMQNALKHDKLNIGYFGHLSAFKGITDYIKATRKIENCKANMFFTFRGKAEKKKIKKLNPRLNIFGMQKDIKKAYNTMDIVVLPYRAGLGAIANPLVLLETMACEKAIITTNIPNIKEIAKGASLMVNPYSPGEIVDAVEKLRDERKRRKLGRKARERIVEHYGERKMFNEYLKLYGEVSKKI